MLIASLGVALTIGLLCGMWWAGRRAEITHITIIGASRVTLVPDHHTRGDAHMATDFPYEPEAFDQ